MAEMTFENAQEPTYYKIPLDDLEEYTGAGSWVGHVDRGGITGAMAAGGTFANTGSFTKAGVAGAFGFAGGVAGSMYNGGISGGGNSRGRVICTHFFRRGRLERDLWRADMEFTFKNLSETTVRGYHFWAIPYVKLMRKSSLAERIMYPLARSRAEEIAFRMGRRDKGSVCGKIVRLIGEPICFLIGTVVRQKDWSVLWAGK